MSIDSIEDLINDAETDTELQKIAFRNLKHYIRVMLPVEVLSVDHDKNQVNLEIKAQDDTGLGYADSFPVLANVPIKYNESSKAFIRCSVQEGDRGTVKFFDSDISRFKKNGDVTLHDNHSYHSLSHGLFDLGFYPESEIFEIENPSDPIIIGLKDVSFTVRVTEDGSLSIDVPTKVEVVSPVINTEGYLYHKGNLSTSTGATGYLTGSTVATVVGGLITEIN